MTNNENIKSIINKHLQVEGFNPDDYKQYYPNGTPYLPFNIQLQWFRMVYPNGKLPVYRPEWTPDKSPMTFVATARVYKDINDPQDAYLAEASAFRGPDVKLADSGESIDPYHAVQVAALSMALKNAGFWCSITDADRTPVLEKANPETTADTSKGADGAENTETVSGVTAKEAAESSGKPAGKKRGRKAAADKPIEAEKPANEVPAENKEPETVLPSESAAETESSVEAEKPADEAANAEESVVKDTAADENTEANPVENAMEFSELLNPPKTEETAVSDVQDAAGNEEVIPAKEEEQTAAEADVANEASEAPENTTETPAVNDTSEDVVEPAEETPVPAEEPEKEVEEAPVEEPPADLEKRLEKLRAIPYSIHYYTGTIGDLEQKYLAGEELGRNIINNLLTSSLVARKFPEVTAAAKELAELVHKDWLEALEEN